MIAPQHGHVISGDLVPLFLDRMEQLLGGYDHVVEMDARYVREYTDLVELMIDYAKEVIGSEEVDARLAANDVDDQLAQSPSHRVGDWKVQQTPYACSANVFKRLAKSEDTSFVDEMRSRVLRHCSERDVPVPLIGWGLESHQSGL
jgi:hypothetical protein